MMWLILFLVRCKYYFGWYAGESSFTACGFSYNGKDERGRDKWFFFFFNPSPHCLKASFYHTCYVCTRDRVINILPLGVELPRNMRQITDSWNICTAQWLKQCTICYAIYSF